MIGIDRRLERAPQRERDEPHRQGRKQDPPARGRERRLQGILRVARPPAPAEGRQQG
jgi:hypothetical protein